MRRYLVSALVVSLLLSFLVVTRGQQLRTGRIEGQITDAAGAVLPGVVVEANCGGARAVVVTDGKGAFAFPSVSAGECTVTATLAGFITATTDIDALQNQTVKMPIVMKVGAMQEAVTVSGSAPAVDGVRPAQAPYASRQMMLGGLGRGGFNTEAYDKIDDNKWATVANRPLSTFSVDVDTASYSNVRRFLNERQMPPKDAVRIEEMINYFSYNYPAPTDGRPFAVTTAIGVCPWNANHRLALVGLQAKRIDSEHMPPRNLVFLVDVSGSMFMPTKLPLVKASLAMLARNLTEKDRVAIVVYAGNAGLVLPSTPGNDTETILDSLQRLEAGGSTNGGAGIMLAYKTAADHFIEGGVNRVILTTDGDFNVGVSNQGDLIRLIEQKRDTGVTLSVLGFGMGNLKDSTMVKLADRGNGNYAYIDTLQEAEKVLVEQAGGTLVTVAKDVKLQVEFNPRAVAAYRLVGYEKRVLDDQDFNDDRKDAGDMGAGHSVTALYEILPAGNSLDVPGVDPLKYQRREPSAAASRNEMMTIKIRYKEPEGSASALMSTTVGNAVHDTRELGFAAAVAEFGMLLRDSEFKGTASFTDVRSRASRFTGDDPHGHKAEFLALVDKAARLRD